MKTVSVSEAKTRLDELIDEALQGEPIVVGRGKRRVLLRPFERSADKADIAEFRAAFSHGEPEPPGAADRIRRVIRRVRRAG